MDNPKSALVLFSGGADSTLMVILALRMGRLVTPLMINYGQKHEEELEFGKAVLQHLWKMDDPRHIRVVGTGAVLPIVELDLRKVFEQSESNLLAGEGRSEMDFPGVHPMHVPARNGTFIMAALSYAESHNLDEVWHGADYSDREHLFPDCYQEWFVQMNALAARNGSRPIKVKAPLLGLEKSDVLTLLKAEGIDLTKVYSGYQRPADKAAPTPDSGRSGALIFPT